jgi:hypothetical protein
MPEVAPLRLVCIATAGLRWSALCLNRHPNPSFSEGGRGHRRSTGVERREPGRERKEFGTVLGREMSIERA